MTHNTPLSPRPLRHLSEVHRRVLSAAQLRSHGVTTAELNERCRVGGPWRLLLPNVVLLHSGSPTSEERLHGALLYASRESTPGVPAQPRAGDPHRSPYAEAMITGLAALALYGFAAAPPLASADRVDVLVPRLRRLRSAGYVRVRRTAELPTAQAVSGMPVAPVRRALADAVARLTDADTVRLLLTEAVREGHCEPAALVRELNQARLLSRSHVVDAVESLVAEGRAAAEDRLYRLVGEHRLPDPVWNVDLRLPGGPYLGGVDAYWPEQAVAMELDTRAPHRDEGERWAEYARKREHLERLGITVVHVTPRRLRESAEQQAAVLRTALMAAGDRDPAAYVVVLPR
ncbi:hypothetical protein [Streptomyces sp. SID4985]|uniref:hypothetical protein n=1 Tax=unclassified Streptomyces TaxID=2593676 RepID=UPI00136AF4E3|nr:hypothetical protein [Streptomyces sp. SID4985]MYQ46965.1 hypothetical protein [Streptomyces sp. SID4985]